MSRRTRLTRSAVGVPRPLSACRLPRWSRTWVGRPASADDEIAPVRNLALIGGTAELAAGTLLERRLEPVVRGAYHDGIAGALLRTAKVLTVAGSLGAAFTARSRSARLACAAALLAASACTRFGVYHAGVASAENPAATIEPQRALLAAGDRSA